MAAPVPAPPDDADRVLMAAQQELEALQSLAGGVAHSVGNPLSTLVAVLDELDESERTCGTDRACRMEAIKTMRQAAQRIRGFIQSVAPAPRIRGDGTVGIEICDFLSHVISLLETEDRFRRVVMTNRFPSPSPRVKGDPARVMLAIYCILSAALEHLNERAGRAKIEVPQSIADGTVHILIETQESDLTAAPAAGLNPADDAKRQPATRLEAALSVLDGLDGHLRIRTTETGFEYRVTLPAAGRSRKKAMA